MSIMMRFRVVNAIAECKETSSEDSSKCVTFVKAAFGMVDPVNRPWQRFSSITTIVVEAWVESSCTAKTVKLEKRCEGVVTEREQRCRRKKKTIATNPLQTYLHKIANAHW